MSVSKKVEQNKQLTPVEELEVLKAKKTKSSDDYERLIVLEREVLLEEMKKEQIDVVKKERAKLTSSIVRSEEVKSHGIKVTRY